MVRKIGTRNSSIDSRFTFNLNLQSDNYMNSLKVASKHQCKRLIYFLAKISMGEVSCRSSLQLKSQDMSLPDVNICSGEFTSRSPSPQKAVKVFTQKSPLDKLLISIAQKKKEVRKVMAQKRSNSKADKLLEKKINEMNKKITVGNSKFNEQFLNKIRENDDFVEGPNFLDKFQKINDKVNILKMKGFRMIFQHGENKKLLKTLVKEDAISKLIKLHKNDLSNSDL